MGNLPSTLTTVMVLSRECSSTRPMAPGSDFTALRTSASVSTSRMESLWVARTLLHSAADNLFRCCRVSVSPEESLWRTRTMFLPSGHFLISARRILARCAAETFSTGLSLFTTTAMWWAKQGAIEAQRNAKTQTAKRTLIRQTSHFQQCRSIRSSDQDQEERSQESAILK